MTPSEGKPVLVMPDRLSVESDPLDIQEAAREFMWLNHGHSMPYGDDGEMQCVQCAPHRWDWKRMPFWECVNAAYEARLGLMVENQRKSPPPQQD